MCSQFLLFTLSIQDTCKLNHYKTNDRSLKETSVFKLLFEEFSAQLKYSIEGLYVCVTATIRRQWIYTQATSLKSFWKSRYVDFKTMRFKVMKLVGSFS